MAKTTVTHHHPACTRWFTDGRCQTSTLWHRRGTVREMMALLRTLQRNARGMSRDYFLSDPCDGTPEDCAAYAKVR
jgi:hypothetical protein